jgi:hypothetical protein
MRGIARKHGFATRLRLTKGATRNRILGDLTRAAKRLKKNDIFFLSYSGHGGQVPNTGNDFEPDGFDEIWCLYDGELIDDELYTELGSFAAALLLVSSPKRYSMQDTGKKVQVSGADQTRRRSHRRLLSTDTPISRSENLAPSLHSMARVPFKRSRPR